MALTGAWKQGAATQALPTKWGTGINPVHAISTEGDATRGRQARLIAPGYGSNLGDIIPIDETDNWDAVGGPGEISPMEPQYNQDAWTPEADLAEAIWGYGDDTGTGDRPRWDARPEDYRGDTTLFRGSEYPGYDEGGDAIRAQSHGADVSKRSKQRKTETVSEGWRNKVNGEVLDSVDASTDQLYMNTSMKQRDAVRSGSQTSGRADEHTAPIRSRIVGMRVKVYSGGERHYDMTPRVADQRIRPWWSREAGTAPEEWMDPNAMRQTTPKTRAVPSDPYAGEDTGAQQSSSWGYVDEDVIPYA